MKKREQMNVVIVGHVDHGKSTVIGRLLADTGALPEGKLEAVKANCERNAKPFEYAFLLDALKDEQSQGITIDTARCFFKSAARDYIIIDAPGHIEFLKNMVTGAARAEAAILVIDAHEGIRENSKRHGYMMSFLGIKNITVCVNKMDLVDYSEKKFLAIKDEFTRFLEEIKVTPEHVIPISAREGENIAELSDKMPWYKGADLLRALDSFRKAAPRHALPFRFPLQDVYKFTAQGDDRRIFAGRIETGSVKVGDEVVFMPSQKRSQVTSLEAFNRPKPTEAFAGESAGFCVDTQVYVRPGEVVCKVSERSPHISTKFKANIFWMGKQPLVKGKTYKLKVATQQVPVVLREIISVLDASELSSISNKEVIDRHDVAECVLETLKPVAFDEVTSIPETGRFVIVDNYEISGGGIILSPIFDEQSMIKDQLKERDLQWERSDISPEQRAQRYGHRSALVVIVGPAETGKVKIAKKLEQELFTAGQNAYFLGIANATLRGEDNSNDRILNKMRHIRQLGELSHLFTDAGMVLIATISDVDEHELKTLKSLNLPHKTLTVNVGENRFASEQVDLGLAENDDTALAVQKIMEMVKREVITGTDEFMI